MAGDSVDPKTLPINGDTPCPKTCGSNSCRGRIKFSTPAKPLCPGIGRGCTAKESNSTEDTVQANRWLTTGEGSIFWLQKKPADSVHGGHLSEKTRAHLVP